MNPSNWNLKVYRNEWTGEERKTWRKSVFIEGVGQARVEVYELGGRYYWSANISVPHRPDISRIAYGTFAAVPCALSVAKGRATRVAGDALRAAAKPRQFARAA